MPSRQVLSAHQEDEKKLTHRLTDDFFTGITRKVRSTFLPGTENSAVSPDFLLEQGYFHYHF